MPRITRPDNHTEGCKCPSGFNGDGINNCNDIDECKEKIACQCPNCKCKNTWGSYECSCSGNLLYFKEHNTCLSKDVATSGGVRRYMDSEIRAIMAQYMPLGNEGEILVHGSHGDI
ncbi:unnamed protein product [Lactuca virosa]|uniref:EGF-like calcium-binding domain-containing protein n=1 Tax=Lactuca virosa TaxID=75947 RepID=A0AAU9LWB8_9ASTR|nr:unnamed protein product [Lactuca virosa]